jgi:predicted nucleic acid-binding Zn ribbon protein
MKFRFNQKRFNGTVSISSLIPEAIRNLEVDEALTIDVIKSSWKGIVDDIIASHSVPERIFRDTLYISVDHTIYANELLLMKQLILGACGMKWDIQ